MQDTFAFFLPTRKGSERVKNKNTRSFAGVEGGLLKLKLKQLLGVPDIPIYVSTNDPETIEVVESFADTRIKIVIRPEELCLSNTILSDLIEYVPTIVEEEHIVWVHVTEPFVDAQCLQDAISIYQREAIEKGDYDSLMSCSKIQTFLWDKEQSTFISHNREDVKWPRSQDLKVIFEINSAIFINSKINYKKFRDRIGMKPYLFELNKLQSVDIDWENDFKMAELLYESIGKI